MRRILFAPIALGIALAVLLPLLFVLQWLFPDLGPREALAVFGGVMLCIALVMIVFVETTYRQKQATQRKSADLAARMDQQAHVTIPEEGVLSGAGVNIQLGQGSDIHAPMYAFGQIFFEMMKDLGAPATAPPELRKDWEIILRWLNATQGAIEQKHREQFARGYVAYLAEGVAPSSSLREAFQRFKDPKLARELCPELNDDMRAVYSRMSRDPATGLATN